MSAMGPTRRFVLEFLLLGAALMFAACGPTYPNCENDDHCSEKGEFCLSGKCNECRTNDHCASKGPGQQCNAGACEQIPGYCDEATQCPAGQKCRDNRCGPECLDDKECAEGDYCSNGSCTARPECGDNALKPACDEGKECVSGSCQIKLTQCGGDPVYFDYNRHNVKSRERSKLNSVAECLKGDNVAPLTIEGHCDERGTEEYNMALGERRANAAKKYLSRKGAPDDKMSTISFGKNRPVDDGSNERAWKKNRRAAFSSGN